MNEHTAPERVLVTGAGSGIGLATSVRLARSGHRVVAAVRDPATASSVERTAARENVSIAVAAIDVTSDDSVRAGLATALGVLGGVDVLINNAGISISDPFETGPVEIAERIFAVNYFGAVRMTQAVLPGMRTCGRGLVLNIGSVSACVSMPALGHYSASKAALVAASESLALEVARFGIRVVTLEPGVTQNTNMFSRRTHLRPIDPDTPYLDDIAALYDLFKRPTTLDVEDVAAVVEQCLAAQDLPLRLVVGEQALSLVGARRAVSDREWIRSSRNVFRGTPPQLEAIDR